MSSTERALMHRDTYLKFYLLICPQVCSHLFLLVAFLPHQRSHFVMMSLDGLFQPLQ